MCHWVTNSSPSNAEERCISTRSLTRLYDLDSEDICFHQFSSKKAPALRVKWYRGISCIIAKKALSQLNLYAEKCESTVWQDSKISPTSHPDTGSHLPLWPFLAAHGIGKWLLNCWSRGPWGMVLPCCNLMPWLRQCHMPWACCSCPWSTVIDMWSQAHWEENSCKTHKILRRMKELYIFNKELFLTSVVLPMWTGQYVWAPDIDNSMSLLISTGRQNTREMQTAAQCFLLLWFSLTNRR